MVNFIIKKFIRLKSEQFSQFFWQEVNVKFDKSHFAECSGHSCWEIKKVLHYPSLILGKKKLITLLSAWDGSRDSTAKRTCRENPGCHLYCKSTICFFFQNQVFGFDCKQKLHNIFCLILKCYKEAKYSSFLLGCATLLLSTYKNPTIPWPNWKLHIQTHIILSTFQKFK